jgi:hypothetical protein
MGEKFKSHPNSFTRKEEENEKGNLCLFFPDGHDDLGFGISCSPPIPGRLS